MAKQPTTKRANQQYFIHSDTVVTRSEADPKERKDFLSMDYDLWVETRKLLKIIPIKIEFKWIESHQDSKKNKNIKSSKTKHSSRQIGRRPQKKHDNEYPNN